MKQNKKLKIALIILIIILISIISFGGIYIQNKNNIDNILPEYILGKDLRGYRRIELKPSDNKKTINYDAQGNIISASDTTTEVANSEEKDVNSKEILTQENYEKCKSIIEKRLNKMTITDYTIKQDTTTGNIVIELAENDNTDRAVAQLSLQGKFEIVDNDTNEVLMTNDDIQYVESGYGSTNSGTTSIFINIQFNKQGTEKFKNITNTYVETTSSDEETQNNETTEETTTENEDKTTTKKIILKVDDSTILTTYFDTEISNGLLQLSVGSSSTSTTEEMQEYLIEANSMEALLDSGNMPVIYETQQNKFIYSDITTDIIEIVACIVIVLATIGMIYFVIKYKTKGILGSILLIGYIAILLIAIRIFNVENSIGGILAIIFNIVLSYTIISAMLKEKYAMDVIRRYALILVPTMIIAIVLTFFNMSIGIVLFWGIAINLIYHLSVSNMMLK